MNHPADSYYLYDETILLEQLSILQKAFPQCRLFYSAKTNPNKHILKTLTGHGCGIDAASAHEVLLAAGLHLSAGDISYSAPGKTKEDIEETLGRCRIVADSLSELKRIDAAAKERGIIADISLRINPDFGMYETSGTPSPFGIDEENLPEALSCIADLPNLRATGIHVHIRSQILDSLVLARYFENVFRLAEKMQSAGFAVRVINFGSGLGIVYDPAAERPLDMQMLSAKMAELTEKYNTSLGAELILEPGRFLVCRCGTYFTRILDKKISRGTTFLIVQGGLNGFMRPCAANLVKKFAGSVAFAAEPLITNDNPCRFFVLNESTKQERVTITGNLCSASDVLAQDVLVNEAETGDMLMVTNAGSYGYSLSLRDFAGQRTPKEFFQTTGLKILLTHPQEIL